MGLVRRRSTILLSATVLAGAALTFEPVILSNLDVQVDGAKISVGAARTPLWSAALAQTPSTIVLDNVSLAFGGGTYRAKRIEFSGVTSSRAEIDAILDGASTEPLQSRLAKLSAREVLIPELVIEQSTPDLRSTATYRNIVMRDLVRGRIASTVAEGATIESNSGKERFAFTFGRTSLADFDTPEIARVYTERAGAQAQPLVKVYGRFDVEDVRVTDGKDVDVRIARIGARDFYGRPTRESWTEFGNRMAAVKPGDKPSGAELSKMFAGIADMMGAFDTSLMEMTGLQVRGTKDNAVGRIARIAYSGSVGGQTPEVRVQGVDVTAKDGSARINTISFAGFSFQPTYEALGSLGNTKLEELDPAVVRKFIPTIGTVRFSGIDFDVPNDEKKGPNPERIRFALKDLELTADKPLNGIPTNIRLGMQNFSFGFPADTKEEGFKDLAALGYKDLNVSFNTAANWNEAGKELVLREVSARGQDMGSVSLKGVFGNVTKDVFGTDSAVALVALVGATAKSAELSVENTGLFDRYLAQEAKKQKKTPEALRREFGVTAAVGIPALLGNTAQGKELGQAVARFIAKPGRLTVAAKTKNGAGLGVADLALLGDPTALLDKLELTATAE
jgi:hypothetical protein